jgi:MFS family permease
MLSDTIGRKKSMLIAATMFSISAIGCAVSPSLNALVIYRIIGGFGIGIVSIVSPMYISEVATPERRGMLVSLYQLAVTFGIVLAYFINFIILKNADTQSQSTELSVRMFNSEYWRGMLGCETIPDLMFFFLIFFIPESPRWLMTHKAAKENKVSEWKYLAEPGILAAVIIGSCIAILGQFMGVNAVIYYGPTIFSKAGLSGDASMFSQFLVGTVNLVTTIIAASIIDKVGRKKLIYYGVSGMIVCLVCIGIYFATGNSLPTWFLVTFFLLYIFAQAISISAVVFVLLSEMYPNRVRGLAMSIAGLALWVGTYLIAQLTPWLLDNENVSSWRSPAGTFFLFAFMCIPYMLIMWKLVPETTGKTLEEIEEYWKNWNKKTKRHET